MITETTTLGHQQSMSKSFKPGYNKIRSPFGGPLFIMAYGRDTSAASLTITITGGIPMTTFKLGQTTESDWATEMQKQPRWVTFQGENAIGLDIKNPYVNANFSQVVAMVKRYDLMVKNGYLISGYDLQPANREDVHAAPQGWMSWERDATDLPNHAGNPVVFDVYHDKDINLAMGTWRVFIFGHEYGHDMQTDCYSIDFGGETTNNMYTLFQIAYFCGDGKQTLDCAENTGEGWDFQETFNTITKPMLGKKTYEQFVETAAKAPLPFWIQIIAQFGYEPIRALHRRLREELVDPSDTTCTGDKYGRFDAVYEILCKETGTDLTKHFEAYGVTLSSDVRQRVQAAGYHQPSVDLSNLMVLPGTPLGWLTNPSYALPPFKTFLDAQ